MIISHDIDYSGVVSDVIQHLKSMDVFILKVWIDNTEIPFEGTDDDDIEFLQQAIKITKGKETVWILYGVIRTFKVLGNVKS